MSSEIIASRSQVTFSGRGKEAFFNRSLLIALWKLWSRFSQKCKRQPESPPPIHTHSTSPTSCMVCILLHIHKKNSIVLLQGIFRASLKSHMAELEGNRAAILFFTQETTAQGPWFCQDPVKVAAGLCISMQPPSWRTESEIFHSFHRHWPVLCGSREGRGKDMKKKQDKN